VARREVILSIGARNNDETIFAGISFCAVPLPIQVLLHSCASAAVHAAHSRKRLRSETSLLIARAIRLAISLTAHDAIIDLILSLHRSLTRREPKQKARQIT
jgi:hypothetical protein